MKSKWTPARGPRRGDEGRDLPVREGDVPVAHPRVLALQRLHRGVVDADRDDVLDRASGGGVEDAGAGAHQMVVDALLEVDELSRPLGEEERPARGEGEEERREAQAAMEAAERVAGHRPGEVRTRRRGAGTAAGRGIRRGSGREIRPGSVGRREIRRAFRRSGRFGKFGLSGRFGWSGKPGFRGASALDAFGSLERAGLVGEVGFLEPCLAARTRRACRGGSVSRPSAGRGRPVSCVPGRSKGSGPPGWGGRRPRRCRRERGRLSPSFPSLSPGAGRPAEAFLPRRRRAGRVGPAGPGERVWRRRPR
jgi:hypothetical protein